jgi:hypothetical protein
MIPVTRPPAFSRDPHQAAGAAAEDEADAGLGQKAPERFRRGGVAQVVPLGGAAVDANILDLLHNRLSVIWRRPPCPSSGVRGESKSLI